MRIGLFTDYFITQGVRAGGIARSVWYLARELSKKGNQVFVFTSSASRRDIIYHYKNLIIVNYARTMRIGDTDLSIKLLYGPLKYDLDVVNVHSGTLSFIGAFLYCFLKRKPLIFSHRGDPIENYGNLFRRIFAIFWIRFIFPLLLRYADVIIALSEQIKEKSRFLRSFKEKIVIIPNGIDPNYANVSWTKDEAKRIIGIPVNHKVVLFVGSLAAFKGPHILLKAMKEVITKVPNTIAILVGPWKDRKDTLKNLVKKLGIENHVIFTGPLPHDKLKLYYRAADVFVLPSFSEGFPHVLLEASLFGLPLVVSNLKELEAIVIDGFNGLFAEKGNAKDFAEKITKLLIDDKLREKLGRNSKNSFKRYSWQEIADRYIKLYKLLAKRKNTSGEIVEVQNRNCWRLRFHRFFFG